MLLNTVNSEHGCHLLADFPKRIAKLNFVFGKRCEIPHSLALEWHFNAYGILFCSNSFTLITIYIEPRKHSMISTLIFRNATGIELTCVEHVINTIIVYVRLYFLKLFH